MKETALAALLCNLLSGGETEIVHYFPFPDEPPHVRVDCETSTHVIEIGVDGSASARDSVHQAIFSSFLTDPKFGNPSNPKPRKTPMVIMIDRDGKMDRWEYEMKVVTDQLGIPYGTCKADFLTAWSASAPFRSLHGPHDLPPLDVAKRHCDLSGQFGEEPAPVFPVLGSDKPDLFADDPAPVRLNQ